MSILFISKGKLPEKAKWQAKLHLYKQNCRSPKIVFPAHTPLTLPGAVAFFFPFPSLPHYISLAETPLWMLATDLPWCCSSQSQVTAHYLIININNKCVFLWICNVRTKYIYIWLHIAFIWMCNAAITADSKLCEGRTQLTCRTRPGGGQWQRALVCLWVSHLTLCTPFSSFIKFLLHL